MAPLDFDLAEPAEPARLEPEWRALEADSDPSFFRSWAWIGSWLAELPPAARPRILRARQDKATVALGLLCRHDATRHGFVRSRGLFLNETGDPALDSLTIEHNGLLTRRGLDASATLADALRFLAARAPDWNELSVGGLVPQGPLPVLPGLRLQTRAVKPAPYADLAAIRSKGSAYLDSLSANTRQQVRRARRLFEARGALSFATARDADQALSYLAELKSLHQAYWTARAKPGSFANPFFERFHDRLIRAHFAAGVIRLHRIAAGDHVIGYLYNFRYRGRVSAYQSGFNYEADAKLKPGLVSHALAIEAALADGDAVYDFLAGEAQHKRSLGTAATDMLWLTWQRDAWAFRLEDGLRRWKHRVTGDA